MYVSPEWLLAAGLVAIYLFDSVQFLQIGEAVVSTRRASLRRLSFGSSFELGGRRPYLPNPLTPWWPELLVDWTDRKSTRLNSSHSQISYAVFCLKKKNERVAISSARVERASRSLRVATT